MRSLLRSEWPNLDEIWLMQNDIPNTVIWSKSKPEVEFKGGGRLFAKTGNSVFSQLWIELYLIQYKMYKRATNVPKLTTNDAYINPRTLLYLFHFGTLDVFYTSWHTRPVGRISGFLVH